MLLRGKLPVHHYPSMPIIPSIVPRAVPVPVHLQLFAPTSHPESSPHYAAPRPNKL